MPFITSPKGHQGHFRGSKHLTDKEKRLLGEIMDKAFEQAAAEIAARQEQPCGHPREAVVSSGEGTNYCGLCAEAAAAKDGIQQ